MIVIACKEIFIDFGTYGLVINWTAEPLLFKCILSLPLLYSRFNIFYLAVYSSIWARQIFLLENRLKLDTISTWVVRNLTRPSRIWHLTTESVEFWLGRPITRYDPYMRNGLDQHRFKKWIDISRLQTILSQMPYVHCFNRYWSIDVNVYEYLFIFFFFKSLWWNLYPNTSILAYHCWSNKG